MKTSAITPEEFHSLTRPSIGLRVSEPWRGHGSALFLELGKLGDYISPKKPNHRKGEATVMIQWSWRVEMPRSIAFGSWTGNRKMDNGIAALKGKKIQAINLVGRIPEISIEFSDSLWLSSFMTTDGRPEWVLFLLDGSWLCYEAGRLVRQSTSAKSKIATRKSKI